MLFSHFVCLFVFFWTLRQLYNFTTSFPAASVCPTSLLPSLPDLTHSFLYLTMIGNGRGYKVSKGFFFSILFISSLTMESDGVCVWGVCGWRL